MVGEGPGQLKNDTALAEVTTHRRLGFMVEKDVPDPTTPE